MRLSSLNVWLKNNQPQQLVKDALRRMLTLQQLEKDALRRMLTLKWNYLNCFNDYESAINYYNELTRNLKLYRGVSKVIIAESKEIEMATQYQQRVI